MSNAAADRLAEVLRENDLGVRVAYDLPDAPGEGITVYPIQSPSLQEFEDRPEQWLDLRWDVDEREPQRFHPGLRGLPQRPPQRLVGVPAVLGPQRPLGVLTERQLGADVGQFEGKIARADTAETVPGQGEREGRGPFASAGAGRTAGTTSSTGTRALARPVARPTFGARRGV